MKSEARQAKAFYPPLFAAFPVLANFSANVTITPLGSLWRPLAVTIIAVCIFWLVSIATTRDHRRAAAMASATIPFIFGFGAYQIWMGDHHWEWLTFPLWVGAGLIALWTVATRWKWHQALNLVSSLLVLTSIGQIAISYGSGRIATESTSGASSAASAGSPDVFYIVLDGHGREDSLNRVIGYDDAWFVKGLQDRGFFVAAKSHSNYVQTEISLASSLNIDFIPSLLPNLLPGDSNRAPLDELVDNSRLFREFKNHGYTTVAITTGFPPFTFRCADLHVSRASIVSLFESALIAMTPFGQAEAVASSQFDDKRALLSEAISNLSALGSRPAKPRFVFAHILAPHPPFVFTKTGSVAPRFKSGFYLWDGSDFMQQGGTPAEYRQGYSGQAEYIERQLLAAIDEIRANDGPAPIIVIQGDHGSKLRLDQNSLAKTDLTECFSNLCAVSAPPPMLSKFTDSISPVNEFRIIVGDLFNERLPLLPDRSWYSPFEHPYRFVDVTDRTEISNKPPLPPGSKARTAPPGSVSR